MERENAILKQENTLLKTQNDEINKKNQEQKNYYENIISNLQTKAFQNESGESQKKSRKLMHYMKKKRKKWKKIS